MKISINAIRVLNATYNCAGDPAPDGIDKLVERIGAQLAAVEETIPIGQKYEGIVIVKVLESHDHENSDHLHVCTIDDGGVTPEVERDAEGHIQVVCGAPNVRGGLTAAWLPPGSTVPSSYDSEPFILTVREIRGQVSNGMLASPKELALGDNHDGILEIEENIAPGTSFADHYSLTNDVIIDMENKMFTHRPDCFGLLGIARELAGIQGQSFTSPQWYEAAATINEPKRVALALEVHNEIPELVPRFVAVALSDITIEPSPVWLQVALSRLGVRPINNIVDLTNYHMLLTGQPLHAYDYDKVLALDAAHHDDHTAAPATIVIRKPHPDETLTLLNGKTVTPRPDVIVIATLSTAIGLGGVMGGADTEVDATTTNIILECASFDMYSIRRTSMASGVFSDAVTRFNKGQSPLQNMAVLTHVVADMQQVAGAKIASKLVDDNHVSHQEKDRVLVTSQFINDRLGLRLKSEEMATLLSNVEFAVSIDNDKLTVRPPFWRTDIEIPEDIVEEIGRLYGFDKLPLELPRRDLTPAVKNVMFELKRQLRDKLSRAGASEALTYSFVHGKLLDKNDQDSELAFKLSNALSPDLQYYRLSLTPSLLGKVHANIKAGYDEFALFEIGKTHIKGETEPHEPTVPKEFNSLSFVYSSKTVKPGAPYYQAAYYLKTLLSDFEVSPILKLEPLSTTDLNTDPWIAQMTAPFAPSRSAVLRDNHGGIWGVVGEYKPKVRKALKLPDYSAGFELDPLLFTAGFEGIDATTTADENTPIIINPTTATPYVVQPRYPRVWQDLCLRVSSDVSYQQLQSFVNQTLMVEKPENSLLSVSPVDIYQRPDDVEHKQITFRVTVASYDTTMLDSEVSSMLDRVADIAAEAFSAERV